MRAKQNWRTITWYATAFVLGIAGSFFVYRPTLSGISEPWFISNDLAAGYGRARALIGSWFSMSDSNLGAPFQADYNHGYPPEDLQVLITRVLVNLIRDPFAAINTQLLLSFGLSAVTFFWLCRKFRISNSLGLALGLSFTFLPFHFTRIEYGHPALADYFMVPIGIWVLVTEFQRIVEENEAGSRERNNTKRLLLKCGLVGAAGAYYAFFFALLAISQACLPWILSRSYRQSRRSLTTRSLLMAMMFMASTIAHNLWTRLSQVPGEVSSRNPGESIVYGGSLTRLLIPWGIWTPDKFKPLVSQETIEATLTPFLVAFGICIVMIWIIRTVAVGTNLRSGSSLKASIVFLMFIAGTFYVSNGFGYIFATLVSPTFRVWSRMSLLISALALIAVGIWMEEKLPKWTEMRKRAALFFVFSLIFLSQLSPLGQLGISKKPDAITRSGIQELKTAAKNLESLTKTGCSVLQFPILRAWSADSINMLSSSNQYWLPLFLPDRKWTYGAAALTKEGEFWTGVGRGGIPELYRTATGLKFCGVILYGAAYPQSEDWFAETRIWEKLASNKALRINESLLFVPFSDSREFTFDAT